VVWEEAETVMSKSTLSSILMSFQEDVMTKIVTMREAKGMMVTFLVDITVLAKTQLGQKRRRKETREEAFAGLAMEAEWKRARAWAKKIAFADVAGVVVWGAVFVFVLIGQRCPSGGFDGW
jgi:hypothetical protein